MTPMGMLADALRANLKRVAESDAKMLRATQEMLSDVRAITASMDEPAMLTASDPDEIADAIALLEANGYTVTPPAA